MSRECDKASHSLVHVKLTTVRSLEIRVLGSAVVVVRAGHPEIGSLRLLHSCYSAPVTVECCDSVLKTCSMGSSMTHEQLDVRFLIT